VLSGIRPAEPNLQQESICNSEGTTADNVEGKREFGP